MGEKKKGGAHRRTKNETEKWNANKERNCHLGKKWRKE